MNESTAPVYHRHDGTDNYQIDPKALLGFPIYRAVPTHRAPEGTPVYVVIAGSPDTYFLYVMLGGGWRGTQLTL